jgi:hypothetical protein
VDAWVAVLRLPGLRQCQGLPDFAAIGRVPHALPTGTDKDTLRIARMDVDRSIKQTLLSGIRRHSRLLEPGPLNRASTIHRSPDVPIVTREQHIAVGGRDANSGNTLAISFAIKRR